MKVEEYGRGNEKTIVMLHGAFFVHSFGRQYPLSEKYHILVPHIMGFGDHTDRIFKTEECVRELAEYIRTLNKKVMLVGFSLGAQLAFKLVSEYEELFEAAIIVSPWLIKKEEPLLSRVEEQSIRQLKQMKNRFTCGLIGLINGLPSKQRKEFVFQMGRVREETVRNVVYNGITLEGTLAFNGVTIPMVALAGEKEQAEVRDSVKRMSERNPNCQYEIWEKAGHNIPPLFAKRFNGLICSMWRQ